MCNPVKLTLMPFGERSAEVIRYRKLRYQMVKKK